MSKFGKQILKRLHPFSPLQNPNNDGHKVIDNSIGEWLDNREAKNKWKQYFLLHATGKYLDLHGNAKGVPRKDGEDDENYRQRILRERGMLNNIRDWKNASVDFWVYVDNLTGVGSELYFQVLDNYGEYQSDVPVSVVIENFSTGEVWSEESKSNNQGIVKFTLPSIVGSARLSYNVDGVEGFSNLEGSLAVNDNVFVKNNTVLFCDNSRYNQLRIRLSTSTGTNLAEQNIMVQINEETFNIITNSDGIATLNYNFNQNTEYDVKYSYEGNNEYYSCTGQTNFNSDNTNYYVQINLQYNVLNNTLTSKNVYLQNKYIVHSKANTQKRLDKKFLNKGVIEWV